MKCKYEGSGVWEGRYVGTKEVDPCVGHEKCERFKPNFKTNADHIRSMTDEELAAALDGYGAYSVCDLVCGGGCMAINTFKETAAERCRRIILEKLRALYKEKER